MVELQRRDLVQKLFRAGITDGGEIHKRPARNKHSPKLHVWGAFSARSFLGEPDRRSVYEYYKRVFGCTSRNTIS